MLASQVSVVLDPEFGLRLAKQVRIGPVWIVDTPTNRAAFEKHWAEHPGESHLDGVTSFTQWPTVSSEEWLIAEIDTIDLHHGSFSANIPYTVLEVLGTSLTSRIEKALEKYGFVMFEPMLDGFRASRKNAESESSVDF